MANIILINCAFKTDFYTKVSKDINEFSNNIFFFFLLYKLEAIINIYFFYSSILFWIFNLFYRLVYIYYILKYLPNKFILHVFF